MHLPVPFPALAPLCPDRVRHRASMSLCLLLSACEPIGGKDDTGGMIGPGGVQDLTAPDQTRGSIASGAAIDLAWAADSSVACWPTTEDLNFDGHHVFYRLRQPEQSLLSVTLQPDDGVDLSLYLLQFGVGAEQLPPNVSQAVSCEAGYDQTRDRNPGAAEDARLTATTNAYDVLIGVAGANGATTGGFELTVALEQ